MRGRTSDALVFGTASGGALRNNDFRKRVFGPAAIGLQESDPHFPTTTPHGRRHTAASLAIAAAPTSRPCSGCLATRRRP
jgi:hypothetical protein